MYHRDQFGLCCGSLVQADLTTLIQTAGNHGFSSISVWPTLYQSAVEQGLSVQDMRQLLEDTGVCVTEIDPLMSWADLNLAPDDMAAAFYQFSEDYFYRMAETLNATTLNVIEYQETGMGYSERVERLGALCQRAEAHGLKVSIEFMSFSPIKDLSTALALVADIGASNVGVNIDLWHHFRGNGSVDDLRYIDPSMVAALQVSDVAEVAWPSLMEETAMGRLLPGDGRGVVPEALSSLEAAGVNVPINLEVFSLELMSSSAEIAAKALAQSVDTVLK